MGIIEKIHRDKLYYEIEGFKFDNTMDHLFSTRIGWNQSKLFHNLGEIFDIPDSKIYRAKQVHGTSIKIIRKEENKSTSMEERDGFITNEIGIALCTYHADCVPIYFYDHIKKVIGLAHGGWKGSLGNISKEVIENMIHNFHSNLKDIKVAIGPSIGKCCYEIRSDLEELFLDKYSDKVEIIEKRNNKIFLDLWRVNLINLLDMGILKENIFLSDTCTSCNIDKFYSYRRENGTKSRMIGSIIMKS